MAALGDPLADLGLHLVYRDPAFDPVLGGSAASTSHRLPGVDDLAEHYALVTGRDLAPLDFYLGLGYFKIAVIAEGIHARHQQGLTVGEGFETVGLAVPQLVAAGLCALTSRWNFDGDQAKRPITWAMGLLADGSRPSLGPVLTRAVSASDPRPEPAEDLVGELPPTDRAGWSVGGSGCGQPTLSRVEPPPSRLYSEPVR